MIPPILEKYIPFNWPLLSIVVHHIIALWPHVYAMRIAHRGKFADFDNRNPRGIAHQECIRKKLGSEDFATYERAEACHKNSMENLPLHIAVVVAGLYAEKLSGRDLGLNAYAEGSIDVRIMYTIAYLRSDSRNMSYFRSVVYNLGVIWAWGVIVACAYIVGREHWH
jgi:uncharacterized MAPEG superfamily protein